MTWIAAELQPLVAVVAAVLDEDGTLIEANAGFLRLACSGSNAIGACVARCFIQPDFAMLIGSRGGTAGDLHRGLLTLGGRLGATRTLSGRVWRAGRHVRMLAEYDVGELERLYATVVELNGEYANAQFALAQANLKLQQREAVILAVSLTDPLTGVGNRRRLDQAMVAEISRADRSGGKLCALMADLDHFKRVNDVHGHEAGDAVLATFGDLLRRRTRANDIVVRFGGEEFVVLMPDTDLNHAAGIAERIREAIAACRVEPLSDPVTASFGVAERVAGEQASDLLRRVDGALYQAKQLGRNRVALG